MFLKQNTQSNACLLDNSNLINIEIYQNIFKLLLLCIHLQKYYFWHITFVYITQIKPNRPAKQY